MPTLPGVAPLTMVTVLPDTVARLVSLLSKVTGNPELDSATTWNVHLPESCQKWAGMQLSTTKCGKRHLVLVGCGQQTFQSPLAGKIAFNLFAGQSGKYTIVGYGFRDLTGGYRPICRVRKWFGNQNLHPYSRH